MVADGKDSSYYKNTREKTRVDLVTGFLGAGKTTFIRRYAKWLASQSKTFAVIENEFGAAGVDAAILKDSAEVIQELAGGCICCSLKTNFHDALLGLSESFDRIIVEPSGIFSPDDFFDVINSPQIKERCEIGGVIAIVDPFTAPGLSGDALKIFLRQISCAGVILISKTGGMTENELNDTKLSILGFLENSLGAPIEASPWDSLTDADFQRFSLSAPIFVDSSLRMDSADHATMFESTTLRPKGIYEPKNIDRIINTALDGSCGIIFRVKGCLNAADGSGYQINCTAADKLITPSASAVQPMLNIIGRQLDRKKLRELFS